MTEEEKNQLKNEIIQYLIENSQTVEQIPTVNSLNGIDSFPALKSTEGQEDQVVRAPILLLQPQFRTQGGYIQYKFGESEWINMLYVGDIGGGSGGTGTYKNQNKTIERIGGLLKGFDSSQGIGYDELFNKIFFPNKDKTFPSTPIFIGFSQDYPNIQKILSLNKVEDYYDFDINEYIYNGYIVIALPATLYLKSVKDDHGMNIVNSFQLIYKSIQTQGISDIYNVYVSPYVYYNDVIELTLSTKDGDPVQVVLNGCTLSINDINPVVNSLKISEGVKSIIKSLKISVRDVSPLLQSIDIDERYQETNINSISLNEREVQVQLSDISISQGTRAILNSITITENKIPVIQSLNIKEGKSILNSISIKDGRAILNEINIKDGRSIINNINIVGRTIKFNGIKISDGRAILNGITITQYT